MQKKILYIVISFLLASLSSCQAANPFVKTWVQFLILIFAVICFLIIAEIILFKSYKSRIKAEEEVKHWKEKEYLLARLVEKGKEFEDLFNNNPMPMWVYDLNTLKFLLVNDAAIKHYGYTKEEFLSMSLKDIRPESEFKKLENNLMLPEQDIEVSNSWLHRKKDGSIINVEIVSHSLPYKNGIHSRLVMAKDVTDKYKLNKELKESEEKYRYLVERSVIGILTADRNGRIIYANSKVCDLMKYTYEELTNLKIPDTYVDEERELGEIRVRNVQFAGVLNYERKVKRKDGSFFYAEVMTSKLEGGKSQAVMNDITDRKKAEEELIRSEKQYKSFFDDDLTGVFRSIPSGAMLNCNPSFLKIFEFSSLEEVLQFDLYKLYPSREVRENLLSELKAKKRLEHFELEMCSKSGKPRYILETMIGVFNSENVLTEITGYMINITERKLAEIQLRTISQIVEQSPQAIVITDNNGIVEYANSKFIRFAGQNIERIIGLKYSVFAARIIQQPESAEFYSAFNNNADWKGQLKYFNNDGEITWEEIATFAIKDKNGNVTHRTVLSENITERKRSEENLHQFETQLKSVWESTSDAMRITNREGKILKVNDAFCRLFNKTKSELEGYPFYVIYKDKSSAALSKYEKKFDEAGAGDTDEIEIVLWDSRKIWVELTNSLLEVNNRQPFMLSIFRNITIRKETESQLIVSKERAEELNRLKDNFLANMSHELRTPMIGIMGFSQLLSINLDDQDYRDMAMTIYNSGKRLLRTLDMIIDLSRLESVKFDVELKEYNLYDLIASELRNYENEAENKKIYLKTSVSDRSITAYVDEKLFTQVLGNLISNAIKFTQNGGVTVEVPAEGPDSSTAVINVIDTGIGIDKDKLDLIFHEFRQASEGYRRKYEGVGIGLTISKKFVEVMNGNITVSSSPGSGSVFTLKFYKSNTQKQNNKLHAGATDEQVYTIPGRKKRILLVDDDDSTVEIVKLVLKKICNVDSATSGEKGVEMASGRIYDLILMDIVLGPGINGIDAMKEIRKINGYETLPFVALTAYAMQDDIPKFIAEGFTHYVSKPFDLNEFRNFTSNLLSNDQGKSA